MIECHNHHGSPDERTAPPAGAGVWSQRWGQAAEVILRADPEVDAVVRGSDQIAAGLVEVARER
ncbi:hypothetical protein GCM10027612_34480 [Microbispora bryophytorum subsp. camponoti]